MTIRAWLRSRTPPAPAPLLARLEAALGPALDDDASSAPARLLDAAVELLRPLVARDDAGRDCALDLLAADALVTYAFEAASDDVDSLDGLTHDAMRRLASLAPDGNAVRHARG